MKELKDKLSSLEQSFAANLKKYNESKGYNDSKPADNTDYMHSMMCDMQDAMSSIRKYVYAVEDDMHRNRLEHSKGHLPSFKTPSSMSKALKTLGLEDDYEVAKKTICVANTRYGLVAEAEYKKDEKA